MVVMIEVIPEATSYNHADGEENRHHIHVQPRLPFQAVQFLILLSTRVVAQQQLRRRTIHIPFELLFMFSSDGAVIVLQRWVLVKPVQRPHHYEKSPECIGHPVNHVAPCPPPRREQFRVFLRAVNNPVENVQHRAHLEHHDSDTSQEENGRREEAPAADCDDEMHGGHHVGRYPRDFRYLKNLVGPPTEGEVYVMSEVILHAQFYSVLRDEREVHSSQVVRFLCGQLAEETEVAPNEIRYETEDAVERVTRHNFVRRHLPLHHLVTFLISVTI